MGSDIEPICPVCCEPAEEIFLDYNNEVCGCDKCIRSRDAFEYFGEQEQMQQDYYREIFMSER